MRLCRFGSVIVIGCVLSGAVALGACAVGSRADNRSEPPPSSAPNGGRTFEPPPPGQKEGQPPSDVPTVKPEARAPAEAAPGAGAAEARGKSPPLPAGFFDAGSTDPIGSATVRDAG